MKKEKKICCFYPKHTFVVSLNKSIRQPLRQVALKHIYLSRLQEVVLDRFLPWLNPCHRAERSLPEETAVRQVHRWKFHLHHQPSSGCGSQPQIWVLTRTHIKTILFYFSIERVKGLNVILTSVDSAITTPPALCSAFWWAIQSLTGN